MENTEDIQKQEAIKKQVETHFLNEYKKAMDRKEATVDIQKQVDEAINKNLRENARSQFMAYTIHALIKNDNEEMVPYVHNGFINISKILAVFIGSTEPAIFINLENGFNYSYILANHQQAHDVVERLMIAIKSNKGHKQELIGVLKTETF